MRPLQKTSFCDISSQELSFYCFSTSYFDFWFSSLAFHPHTTELVRPIERSSANPQIINVNTSRGEFVTSGFEVQRGISESTVSLFLPFVMSLAFVLSDFDFRSPCSMIKFEWIFEGSNTSGQKSSFTTFSLLRSSPADIEVRTGVRISALSAVTLPGFSSNPV